MPIAPAEIVMVPASANTATDGTAPGDVATEGTGTRIAVATEPRARDGKTV